MRHPRRRGDGASSGGSSVANRGRYCGNGVSRRSQTMKYIRLGRSGLLVSRLALGCMSYGTPKWRPWVLSEADSMPFFRRAIEAGINFFDTADMYSLGVSEQVTGKALREYGRREELVIATKVFFPTADGPNRRGLSRKHRFDPETPQEETLAALDQLVRTGKVLYLGASSGPAWKLAGSLALADRHGFARFISMQNHYNLVYREEEREMIPLCQTEGIGTVPWSPLARGLLAGKRKSREDKTVSPRASSDSYTDELYDQPSDWEVVEATSAVAAKRGVQPSEVALAWLLSRPTVAAPIIGATKLEHLEAAIRALDLELSAEEKSQLEKPYRPHPVKGWI